ncbi:uncharacterized protein PG998_004369 [Apiospora kogelbergensis]|uniref:Uncharacterized protein n=1 Tax=Apiospora kogelbergensis TaxID=1337665 RepID=A0AAW0QS55_9PEZI
MFFTQVLGSLAFAAMVAAAPTQPLSERGAGTPYTGVMNEAQCKAHKTRVTKGDADKGFGVSVKNDDSKTRSFFVYSNGCERTPYTQLADVGPGKTAFVALPAKFQGRLQRGTAAVHMNKKEGVDTTLGTWLELGYDASGVSYGDVSLIRGCDGGVTLHNTDGTKKTMGFSANCVEGAPKAALGKKLDGGAAVLATEGFKKPGEPNPDQPKIIAAPRDWLLKKLTDKSGKAETKAYIDDYHGNPVIADAKGRWSAIFHKNP